RRWAQGCRSRALRPRGRGLRTGRGRSLPDLIGSLLVPSRLRRLRRTRPIDAQTGAAPEQFDLALDFLVPLNQILEDRLVPLEASDRDELHPLAPGSLVRRFGAAVPDRHIRVPRHEVSGLWAGSGAFQRFVNQHAVREIELEVLLIEIEAIALVPLVRPLVESNRAWRLLGVLRDHAEQLHLLVLVPRISRIVQPGEAGHPPATHGPVIAGLDRACANPCGILREEL